MQNANAHRGKMEGKAASWRRARRGVAWRGVPCPRGAAAPTQIEIGGDFLSALLEGVGLEPHPDNDIQKSNSEVSNNNGATVNLQSWTGAKHGPRRCGPNKYIPVTYS